MVPHKTPSLFKYIWPSLVWNVPNAGKKIFLTFDDGPIPELTEWVLETLAQFNIKATFFCVGENVDKHPEVFDKLLLEGHSIGNHTHHHLNGRKALTQNYLDNVALCDEALAKHNETTELFRPPYGRLKTRQRKLLKNRKVVMWDVLSKDYDQSLSPEIILDGIIKATQPGSIVVFHDNLKAEKNLKVVLPKYIQHFLNQGYQFGRL
ncbi:polysaccharide deacetylase family protein [Roseivirga sp. E12]|uniref:polysaccharide deacetylase family protein n=1 Tax=Roseivirga sp. E12 TaxID=2819237 RepID=UPI001ABBFF61|nr:polysaccharide deacetylase family protein [Roseivirga sp. E12]MBO3698514.1 polysaccharide deacetylase family protein [Roseivirga sp. E12]